MHPVAFCRWTGCTQWFCLKDFVCSVYIKIVINNQNSCLCSNWKRYEIGPWLPWITNGKSQVANQSVSVSMNDLQKWNARDQIFLVDRCNYGHTVWPRMTWLIWLDDTWWRSIFQWGQPHPVLNFFLGPPTCTHTAWETATKFCIVIIFVTKFDTKQNNRCHVVQRIMSTNMSHDCSYQPFTTLV